MLKPQLVAVDTNLLLKFADGHEPTLDACHLIERRIRPVQFVVAPTVLEEVGRQELEAEDERVRAAARRALLGMRRQFKFHPAGFNAVQEAIAENAARHLRDSGLLPYDERHDAFIVAESAVLQAVMLVSHDSHLLNIDHARLTILFGRLDLPAPIIASPENLLKKFYR